MAISRNGLSSGSGRGDGKGDEEDGSASVANIIEDNICPAMVYIETRPVNNFLVLKQYSCIYTESEVA
jgi:hypothetical protein